MAQHGRALALAGVLSLVMGLRIFSGGEPQEFGSCTLSSYIFLTALFSFLAGVDFIPSHCPVPAYLRFFLEFLVSLFIFDLGLHLVWQPFEFFVSAVLPYRFGSRLECCYGLLDMFFSALVLLTAVTALAIVLYGHGIVTRKKVCQISWEGMWEKLKTNSCR